MRRQTYLLLFLLLQVILPTAAQEFSLQALPNWDKLPARAIHRIYQDREGYIWFGTYDGLLRYDGYSYKSYRSDLKRPNLFANNFVTCILEDGKGRLWIGTVEGLYVLNRQTDELRNVRLTGAPDVNIFTLSTTPDGRIWVCVKGKLYELHEEGSIERVYDLPDQACAYLVTTIPGEGTIVSVEWHGMYRLNGKHQLVPYHHDNRFKAIEGIITDKVHHCYWLNTWDAGVVRFDPKAPNGQVYAQQPLPKSAEGQTTPSIYHMVLDSHHSRLWLTTWHGLNAYRINADATLTPLDVANLLPRRTSMLYDLIQDRRGNIWVSSLDNKSFVIRPQHKSAQQTFVRSANQLLTESFDNNPSINAICRDGEGYVWANQNMRGLLLMGPCSQQGMFARQWRDIPGMNVEPNLLSPALEANAVWCANNWYNRICKLVRNGESIQCSYAGALSVKGEENIHIQDIVQTSPSTLSLATNKGFFLYQPASGKAQPQNDIKGDIRHMKLLPDGMLWMTVDKKGLYALNTRQRGAKPRFYGLPKLFSCMACSFDGKLWLGTSDGELLMMDTQTGKWQDYSASCNLQGDMIVSVLVDEYNHVWLSTERQLIEFSPASNVYRLHHDTDVDRYQVSLVAGQTLYFAGGGGLIMKSASHDLERIPPKVKTTITSIQLGDEYCGTTLPPDAAYLRISFSTFDYLDADHTRYAIQMEGVDRDWVYLAPGQNYAFYNTLPKGKHHFRVKATSDNGLWSSEVTDIVITRLPHWWESWWAYMLYALALLLALAWGALRYKRHVNRRNTELLFDTQELIHMKQYVEMQQPAIAESASQEYIQLDKILLDKVHQTVIDHISDSDFDVNAFASAMNMSRSTLSRKIKVLTGKTPLDYIRDIKMEQASKMLLSKTASVQSVIHALGYTDHKNFVSVFKKQFGMSPTEWQKSQQK